MNRKTAANLVLKQLLARKALTKADINRIIKDSHGATQIIDYIRETMCIDVLCKPNKNPQITYWYMTDEGIQLYMENPIAHMAIKRNANKQKAIERDGHAIKKIYKKRGIEFINTQLAEEPRSSFY